MNRLLLCSCVSLVYCDYVWSMKGSITIDAKTLNIRNINKVDINQTGKDIDLTEFSKSNTIMHLKNIRPKMLKYNFDQCIPMLGTTEAKTDVNLINNLEFLISKLALDRHKIFPRNISDFLLNLSVNCAQSQSNISSLPNKDMLYYRMVQNQQHLFLHISYKHQNNTRNLNKALCQNSICAYNSDAYIQTDYGTIRNTNILAKSIDIKSNDRLEIHNTQLKVSNDIKLKAKNYMLLNHMKADANDIFINVDRELVNIASKLKANWIISIKADTQRHETVINKWIRQYSSSDSFTHAEGISSIDDCCFIASKVVQNGRLAENYGIFVMTEDFEDQALHTINKPAKITLYNHACERNEGFFSSAESSVTKIDDVLIPNRYYVNYYRSSSEKPQSSVKYGYTLIDAGSIIEVTKDIKEDLVIPEHHSLHIHESKSGFTLFGGPSVPDPTVNLKNLGAYQQSGNMIGLTTAAISAVAKGIRLYHDIKDFKFKDLLKTDNAFSVENAMNILDILSKFVNGPAIQFGSRSIDFFQQQTISRGNKFIAPVIRLHNKISSSMAGEYRAKEIDIKTKTFITFDLPQTFDSNMSVHQSGVKMDLLTFALACYKGLGIVDSALKATSISVSSQSSKMHANIHKPTVIHATENLNIEAENGYLSQAKIKAAVVHAIFSKDLVLESLYNVKWSKNSGGMFSFGLSGFTDFSDLSKTLIKTAASSVISNIDSGSFEQIIDDFAEMVGEKDFYLKVGNVLKTKSAFLGHVTHDLDKEHIDAKIRIDEVMNKKTYVWDRSFNLVVADFATIASEMLGNSSNQKDKITKKKRSEMLGNSSKQKDKITEEKRSDQKDKTTKNKISSTKDKQDSSIYAQHDHKKKTEETKKKQQVDIANRKSSIVDSSSRNFNDDTEDNKPVYHFTRYRRRSKEENIDEETISDSNILKIDMKDKNQEYSIIVTEKGTNTTKKESVSTSLEQPIDNTNKIKFCVVMHNPQNNEKNKKLSSNNKNTSQLKSDSLEDIEPLLRWAELEKAKNSNNSQYRDNKSSSNLSLEQIPQTSMDVLQVFGEAIIDKYNKNKNKFEEGIEGAKLIYKHPNIAKQVVNQTVSAYNSQVVKPTVSEYTSYAKAICNNPGMAIDIIKNTASEYTSYAKAICNNPGMAIDIIKNEPELTELIIDETECFPKIGNLITLGKSIYNLANGKTSLREFADEWIDRISIKGVCMLVGGKRFGALFDEPKKTSLIKEFGSNIVESAAYEIVKEQDNSKYQQYQKTELSLPADIEKRMTAEQLARWNNL